MRNFSQIETSIKQCAQSEPDLPLEKILLIRLLLHSSSAYLEHRNTLLKKWELNDTLFMALVVLYTQPEHRIQPSKLSDILGSSRTNATRISDELVGRGWIERVIDEADRRSFLLRLTEKGIGFIRERMPQQWENIHQVFRGITPEEMRQLSLLLHKVVANVARR
ncbi:transcriptional repressor MprA [Testudinibacter sp. TR-2022]|uniref:transcriptional repressor MprA n=1 Tax=Testudinibacter sp. TR-2022 TaxID=2585029 RepID=UPI001119EAAF|nr:transcriptional repressor MprA [Testudinibacter sp. TR-2022]TNH04963.1 transcriptional repressor MprA [Pasteurellaceae bacterium Phil31]TNH09314.1 transcriptional repressor MprA [Testudinibacter sp. TR-2022]TNH09632.1 transcriptional repressor MprA [Testudinibacter sp. TR-2022]TNH13473.1 transcriptional repressor MprA [Testudinibacter sp. TR-2022]TNH19157.1 transcriptional repressor MprA [Testudinibacter sp. TR-2022]